MKKFFSILMFWSLLVTGLAFAKDVQVCFTPNSPCQKQVVSVIDHANKTLKMQVFMIRPSNSDIVSALIRAKKRGVDVQVLLDNCDLADSEVLRHSFKTAGIPYLVNGKTEITAQ